MGLGHTYGVKVLRIDRPDGRRVLKFDGLSGRGLRIARRAMSIIMPPFGGHVHIEYHNHSSHRLPLHRSTHSEE